MLKIHELLNRFEILYPSDKISDLRRAYIDKDLSTIFRLIDGNKTATVLFNKTASVNIDELRKAVLEQNLYSIFRLTGQYDTDLRKLILEDNMHSMWNLLSQIHDSSLFGAIKKLIQDGIEFNSDALSQGQLKSKKWLIDELSNVVTDLGTVFLCAGWYGTLATLLFESDINIEKIRSFDIDPDVWKIAESFNRQQVSDNWKFKASTFDILKFGKIGPYDIFKHETIKSDGSLIKLYDEIDTIINTSCEHIINFDTWYNNIQSGTLLILQGNNFFDIPDHVNCHKTLNEFSASIPMSKTLYEGELVLPDYTRFMKIGIK